MDYITFLKKNSTEGSTCPFCHELKKDIIEENNTAFLTYALAPYHKHHMLIVPKRHVSPILDLTPEEVTDLYSLEKIGITLIHKLGYDNLSILLREGKASGKTVDHLHYHIVPETVITDVEHGNTDFRHVLSRKEGRSIVMRLKKILKSLKVIGGGNLKAK